MKFKVEQSFGGEGHYNTSFTRTLREAIDDINVPAYHWEDERHDPTYARDRITANILEFLVNKGLMNNEEFKKVLELSENSSFNLVPEED
jgi:hypothetical protein